jgi:hypothetical protein
MSSSPVRVTPSRTGHPPRKATPRSHQSVTPYRAIRQGRPRPRGCGQQRDSTHGPTRRVWQRRALSSTWAAQARERSAAPDDHPRRALPTAGRMRSARPGPDATKVDTSTKRLPMYRYIVKRSPPWSRPTAVASQPSRWSLSTRAWGSRPGNAAMRGLLLQRGGRLLAERPRPRAEPSPVTAPVYPTVGSAHHRRGLVISPAVWLAPVQARAVGYPPQLGVKRRPGRQGARRRPLEKATRPRDRSQPTFSAHETHRIDSGRTSSRSAAIGSPHSTQEP